MEETPNYEKYKVSEENMGNATETGRRLWLADGRSV